VVFIRGPEFACRLRIAKPTCREGKDGVEGAVPARRQVRPLFFERIMSPGQSMQMDFGQICAHASRVPGTVATYETPVPRQRIFHVLPPSAVVER
jgi:hypothetical protein